MPLLLLPLVFLVCGGWNGGSSDAGATLGVTRCNSYIPVVPHKAVAEVSRIGNV